jgi:hypothetical protein
MKPLPVALVILAVIFAILAVLYEVGTIQFLTSEGTGRHTKHAIVLGVLAVVSLIGANFARTRTA